MCQQCFLNASTAALHLWESNLPGWNSFLSYFLPSCFLKVFYSAEYRKKKKRERERGADGNHGQHWLLQGVAPTQWREHCPFFHSVQIFRLWRTDKYGWSHLCSGWHSKEQVTNHILQISFLDCRIAVKFFQILALGQPVVNSWWCFSKHRLLGSERLPFASWLLHLPALWPREGYLISPSLVLYLSVHCKK